MEVVFSNLTLSGSVEREEGSGWLWKRRGGGGERGGSSHPGTPFSARELWTGRKTGFVAIFCPPDDKTKMCC